MRPIVLGHLYYDLLKANGDSGNISCLKKRCEWRGLPVRVKNIESGSPFDLNDVDILFLGGGTDREQDLALRGLTSSRDVLREYIEEGGVLLAVGGGFQILGTTCLIGGKVYEGLSLLDMETRAASATSDKTPRLSGHIVLESPLSESLVLGFENHAGRTYLGSSLESFGKVFSSQGWGNNDEDAEDGVWHRHTVGSYLHGPLLAKNPQIADRLLVWAAEKRLDGKELPFDVCPLDDSIEDAARNAALKRLGLKNTF